MIKLLSIALLCALSLQLNAQHVVLTGGRKVYKIEAASLNWFASTDREALKNIPVQQLGKQETWWNIWTNFSISNKSGADQELVLQIPRSGYASAFTKHEVLRTGSLLPLEQRSLKAGANGFVIQIKNGEAISILLRLREQLLLLFFCKLVLMLGHQL